MEHGIRAVSIGGGTGQPRAIAALRHMGASIDSVVAMADDGGSTGVLRERAGILPPGDVRKCLSALAGDPECAFARAFAHRFPYIDDHALGNLVLTALAEETDSFSQAIRVCEELLRCVGHVHPSTLDPVTMSGVTVAGQQIHGQARISYGGNAMRRVWLDQQDPAANPRAVEAILAADLVVLGPGSLFTSIVPNLQVPGIAHALAGTHAVRVFVCPKIDSLGETQGMSVADHVDQLLSLASSPLLDAVLVHHADTPEFVYPYAPGPAYRSSALAGDVVTARDIDTAKRAPFGPIQAGEREISRIEQSVPVVLVRDFTGSESAAVHDVKALASALEEVLDQCRSARR